MVGLACVLFLDLASGLVVGWPVVVALVVVWSGLFVVACAWWTPHPARIPWLAATALGVWLVLVIGGSIAFG
jgi:hypothetical protein